MASEDRGPAAGAAEQRKSQRGWALVPELCGRFLFRMHFRVCFVAEMMMVTVEMHRGDFVVQHLLCELSTAAVAARVQQQMGEEEAEEAIASSDGSRM